ncbi:BON domain-containing protein [Rhodoblastus acidophilus]|jgi:osmotically-inducible protein OsmY|uniref:BON domain-containing protein n=1 Tax=Rhodoblastus acidophilus TaxID=1074 RepID=A0A6N8DQL1_RHOAC|nr:BON domain-containing protein [Rhodoblastus acidophilus]MCW2275629.1 osmotically-inducible protein OsmY [Rhodoblastus acidophilus]MTV32126.1 BON domain-containing protein [Rhodoblastus acidophilus]
MSNDKVLKQAVLDELEWDPSVNAAHIGVSAKNGIVTLMGHVESYPEKFAAEKAARKVNEVKGVAEEIEVRLPFEVKHGDEEIAAAAIDRLKWSSTIPRDAVKVKVEKGCVTLTGEVDWHYQQNAATEDVRRLWGVVGVSNQITLKPKPNVSNIQDKIKVALNRSWFDPAAITVSAHGGTVKLTGDVHSLVERDEADAAAWASPGTMFVENNISVV